MNISGSFELINPDIIYKAVSWSTVPREDLVVNGIHESCPSKDLDSLNDDLEQQETASLEIRKPLDLLSDDLQIVVTPSNQKLNMKQIFTQITENVVPMFIYIIDQDTLSPNDVEELRLFRSIVPNEPILFIRIDQTDKYEDKGYFFRANFIIFFFSSSSMSEASCVQTFR